MRKTLTLSFAALLLGSCAAPKPPIMPVPAAWQQAGDIDAVWPDAQWWHGFQNDELARLIDEAAANSTNLRAAFARILQAEAQAKIARGALWPTLSAGGGVSRAGGDARSDSTNFSANLSAAYQVDLFGEARAGASSAELRVESSLYDRETVRITLFSDVAITYLQILSVRDRIRLAQERLRIAESVLDLVEAQRRIGVISELELAQQRAAIASQRSVIPGLIVSERQLIDALAVLLGRLPQGFDVQGRSLAEVALPTIVAGLPAGLLDRRPDLRSAEADLRANGFDVAAARAARLPGLSLTASGGTASDSLSGLFSTGTFVTNLAASLAAPIFAGNRLEGQEQATRARRLEMIENYKQATLSAFADVENTLTAATQNNIQYGHAQEAYRQSVEAYRLAELRYRAGTVDFQALLNAQTSVLQAQDSLVQSGLTRLTAVVNLTTALGGGWDGAIPQPPDLAESLAVAFNGD